jgi:molybdenum cofactor cytidylyltransferase
VECVVNPNYAKGMTTSLQSGLRAVPPETTGVLFTLVDHPAVRASTLDSLLGSSSSSPARSRLRVPRYEGQRGHPIWFSGDLIPEFLAIPEFGAARDVVRAHAFETEFVDVDDPGILADIDDAAAYRRLTGTSV